MEAWADLLLPTLLRQDLHPIFVKIPNCHPKLTYPRQQAAGAGSSRGLVRSNTPGLPPAEMKQAESRERKAENKVMKPSAEGGVTNCQLPTARRWGCDRTPDCNW